MGDDHTAESSTTAHQSEYHFVDVMIPILNPAGVQEIIDYGLYGWAMSRFTGAWTALKCMHETVESTAVVDGSLDRVKIIIPDDFAMPPGGLNIRLGDTVLGQEARLHDFKRDAMLAFVRANRLNRMICSGGRNPKIGVITVGKSYLDVRQALDELGLDEVKCNDLGLRLYKIGCPWPISRLDLMEFAPGLELIIVVEEKRSLIEVQVREELYGTANQPVCIGKKDEHGNWLFPVKGALDPNDVAICIGERLLNYVRNDELAARVARLKEAQRVLAETEDIAVRIPYFCSGCPHNSSTVVPEGSRAYAGIGCHYMAQWMDRSTSGYTQMGGEGANWIGEAPFSKRGHVFQNLGDGTYNHSGSLAVRAAIQAGVNITYKILFNDAVAMTGGQRNDGNITVPQIAAEMAAEGAKRVVVVTDEPWKYPAGTKWPAGLTIHHRDDLQEVQKELARGAGLHGADLRPDLRRREAPPPQARPVPRSGQARRHQRAGLRGLRRLRREVELRLGAAARDRVRPQAHHRPVELQQGLLLREGLLPVLRHGGGREAQARQRRRAAADDAVPAPVLPAIDKTYGIIVTGIGGTGIVTIGAILGMAAHLEGKGVGIIDMAGLAQKGGAVDEPHPLRQQARGHPRDPRRRAARRPRARRRHGGRRRQEGAGRGEARHHRHGDQPRRNAARRIHPQSGILAADRAHQAHHHRARGRGAHPFRQCLAAVHRAARPVARRQHVHAGLCLPARHPADLGAESIEKAIELNGEAVAMNHAAFRWGRRAAIDLAAVEALARPAPVDPVRQLSKSLDEMVARRVEFLTAYQNAAYAERYRRRVAAAQAAEAAKAPGQSGFAEAVARYLFKLMAYKDEYEVARLYADPAFLRR